MSLGAPSAASQAQGIALKPRNRRLVELRAYGVRASEEIVDMKVMDLCYDGCRVEASTPLALGEVISLSVLGRGGAQKARVRWCDGRNAGLLFETGERTDYQARQSERISVVAKLLIRRPGRVSYGVTVYDVSRFGARCEFVERPAISDRVWLKFDNLEAHASTVRWVEGSTMGLEFARPLHPAVFELLLQRLI